MSTTPVFLGEKPNGISPSRVSQFANCPRQYQYVSVEKLPEKKSIDAYRGTIFHAILETMFAESLETPEARTLDNCLEYFRTIFPTMVGEVEAEELGLNQEGVQQLAAEVTKLIRNYYKMEDPTTINTEAVEIRFDHDMGGWGLRGIIDRLDRLEDGTLAVVDYKTGKPPRKGYEAKALQPCQTYAYLCQQVRGELPTELRLIYVKTGTQIVHRVTPSDIASAERRVRGTWQSIEKCYDKSDFPAKPSILCNWCSFQKICQGDQSNPF